MSKYPYVYSSQILKNIANSYDHIYQGIEVYYSGIYRFIETSQLSIAEHKADFDTALNAIGRGNWLGRVDSSEFNDFKRLGRLQRIVIADIYGISDYELEAQGFYCIPRLRGYAYSQMKAFLNGEPMWGAKNIVPKSIDRVIDNI